MSVSCCITVICIEKNIDIKTEDLKFFQKEYLNVQEVLFNNHT